jgi:uncharacterized membrane protein
MHRPYEATTMTLTRVRWLLLQVTRKLWFRSAVLSGAAVATALLAAGAQHVIPADMPAQIGADAVDSILEILAASMLAVTIFSVSTVVSALSAASSQVTPRATRLLIQDPTAHNALGTFLGAFLFSLVGIIALSTGVYGERGRVVLFAATLLVVLLIVVTLLRWIDHVSRLGRVADSTGRVEEATATALRERHRRPWLDGQPLPDPSPAPAPGSWPLLPPEIGYVQHIDMPALDTLAQRHGLRIRIGALPGVFAEPSRPLATVTGECDDGVREALCAAFSVGDLRSYDQDPRFGLVVLSEIAQRGLSPGLNDPGTAIDVIGRQVRLLALWAQPGPLQAPSPRFPRVEVPAIAVDDLFDDAFAAIARDGAAIVEVGVRLQKALRALSRIGDVRFRGAAARLSRLAVERARHAGILDADLQVLTGLARGFAEAADGHGTGAESA